MFVNFLWLLAAAGFFFKKIFIVFLIFNIFFLLFYNQKNMLCVPSYVSYFQNEKKLWDTSSYFTCKTLPCHSKKKNFLFK